MHQNTHMKIHPVLTSFSLASIPLKNRVAVAPMSRVSASSNGVPTDTMRHYYTSFAEGQFGMIITEGTYTDQAYSQAYAHQPGIVTEAQIQAWRTLMQSVHTAGSSIFLQLMHAGALSQENHYCTHTLAPSAVQPKGEKIPEYGGRGPFPVPEAMSEKHIQEAIDGEVIFSALAEAGVSYLHLASEGRDWRKTASIGDGVTITQLARRVAHVPVIANGGMHDPSLAEQIINEGHADMISLARGALVHADWPQRVAQGLALEIFDPEILHPRATIENALRWRALRDHH